IAQLYEQAGNAELATLFYERAKKRTLDPVLEVYAILNGIRQKTSDSVSTEKSVEELKKMGKRDRYSKYRDIIYYTAAQIELDRNNIHGAKAMLHKATSATAEINNPAQRTRAFLLLADLLYHEKNFSEAKRFYDSVNNNDPGVSDPIAFDQRKETVHQIVDQLEIINRQDSLQHLAAMPEADRN